MIELIILLIVVVLLILVSFYIISSTESPTVNKLIIYLLTIKMFCIFVLQLFKYLGLIIIL